MTHKEVNDIVLDFLNKGYIVIDTMPDSPRYPADLVFNERFEVFKYDYTTHTKIKINIDKDGKEI